MQVQLCDKRSVRTRFARHCPWLEVVMQSPHVFDRLVRSIQA